MTSLQENFTLEKVKFWMICIFIELEQEASHSIKTEKHISPGEAKFLWELIQDYGENYEAMKRDKRNYYQHTANQLRRKCMKFLNSNQDFSKYIHNLE